MKVVIALMLTLTVFSAVLRRWVARNRSEISCRSFHRGKPGGHDSHGIGMIPSYVHSWSQGHPEINHHAKIIRGGGGAVHADGDRAFGQVAAHEAMALGIKAHQHGIAAWRYITRIISAVSVTGRSSVSGGVCLYPLC
ncbi:Ldh family oxidoreductase [Shigella flexneri]